MGKENLLSKRSYENRGLTLAEILVVLSIVGILMTAIFGSFKFGLSAFHRTSTKNELNQELQVLHRRLLADLEISAIGSVSVFPTGGNATMISFLSPLDSDGNFIIDSRGRPDWQKYVIYYHSASDSKIYRTEVTLIATATERQVPTPIETYNDGGGLNSLSFYATGGRKVCDFAESFVPDFFPAPRSEVNWTATVERTRYGRSSESPETLTGSASAFLRN